MNNKTIKNRWKEKVKRMTMEVVTAQLKTTTEEIPMEEVIEETVTDVIEVAAEVSKKIKNLKCLMVSQELKSNYFPIISNLD